MFTRTMSRRNSQLLLHTNAFDMYFYGITLALKRSFCRRVTRLIAKTTQNVSSEIITLLAVSTSHKCQMQVLTRISR